MEKVKFRTLLCTAILTTLITPASAGTYLVSPPPARDPNYRDADNDYPESRFGERRPAGRAEEESEGSRFGSGAFASREVKDMERESRDEFSGSRSPASEGPARQASTSSAGTDPVLLDAARRNGVQEVSIIAGDLGYFPKTIFVTRDIPVRMYVTGASKNSLCIMMDSFQVRKQVRSQKIEEISFTPSTPGKYRFYCPVNGMEGTMVVRELSSN